MSELGHPLVGDITYGFSVKKLHELKVTRFFLHAAELGFVHPKTGEEMSFSVRWPKEDAGKLNELGFFHDSI
jgi:23S rRNA pseudouridine1911/1915/1917 synthase